MDGRARDSWFYRSTGAARTPVDVTISLDGGKDRENVRVRSGSKEAVDRPGRLQARAARLL
jgi:hypothetical protein